MGKKAQMRNPFFTSSNLVYTVYRRCTGRAGRGLPPGCSRSRCARRV